MCITIAPTPVSATTLRISGSRKPGHIVDDHRATLDGSASNEGFHRVDRDTGSIAGERFHDRQDPRTLLFCAHRVSARTGRFATDVEDVGARLEQ